MIRFAYQLSFGGGKSAAVRRTLIALALAAAAGCTAGTKPAVSGAAGSGGSGTTGVGGRGGTTGVAGSFSLAGQGGTVTTNPDGGSCQMKDFTFEPKIPTVFVLVDRSGSMFQSETTGTFFTLRSAVLQVIQQLQGQVRFGFGAFVGNKAVANGCPTFTSVPASLDNYSVIATAYNGIGPLLPYGTKADTPAFQVIPMVKAALAADAGTGQKYMLFVTDSESDFCDDGSALCPADAVTYQIQDMRAAGFGTLVIGLPTSISPIADAVLQNFANAGAGMGAINPPGSGAATLQDIFYQCQGAGSGAWMSQWTAAGRTGLVPLATYSTTPGTAQVYAPTSTSQQALYDQIAAALSDVKSCIFDLTPVRAVLSMLNKASVLIENNLVPLDPTNTNGWNMNTETQLQLYGPACDAWRNPDAKNIQFNFPCEIIVD